MGQIDLFKNYVYVIGILKTLTALWNLCGVEANMLNSDIAVSSNSNHGFTFPFGLIPMGKVGTPSPAAK